MFNSKLMTIARVLVICLGISLLFATGVSLAETASDGLSVTYTAQPVSMVVPEEVLVRLTLIFSDTRSIGNIRLCREDGSVIANVNKDNITSGAPYVLSDTVIPTEKQLNNGLMVYSVRYTEDYSLPSATELEQSVGIQLEKLPAVPGIEFTRSTVCTLVSRDSDAKIIYGVYNSGNVAITNLFVSDVLIGEVARVDKLEPGQRMSFVKSARIKEDAVSVPKIVYSHAATSDSFSSELAPTAISVANEDLRIILSCDSEVAARNGSVVLKCSVVNQGDVSYGDITVNDDTLGGVLFPAAQINPREECFFSKTVSISGDASFKYTLSAVCETGERVSVDSNRVYIEASQKVSDSIDLSLAADVTSLNNDGVTVELRLTNNSLSGIKNVRLSERSRGIFKTLFITPPGQTVLTRTFAASRGEKLAFMAEVSDANGGVMTILSNEVAADDQTPMGESGETAPVSLLSDMGVSLKIPDVYNTYTNMILIGSLVLLLLIIVAIISMSRRRRAQKKRDDERANNVRRAFMRAGKGQEAEDIDSADITLAVYDELRKDKKKGKINDRDRRPGSI